MERLGKILQKHKENKGVALDEKTAFYLFFRVIEREYGQAGQKVFAPDRLEKNTLYVGTQKATWAQELWCNRGRILSKINRGLRKEQALSAIKVYQKQ